MEADILRAKGTLATAPIHCTGERGSALLIVFLFAAVVAIMLYKEMPIAAFEAQRQKEQLLVDRGEEYKRAVKLYVIKFGGNYPSSIDQLEHTNNIRFLRHRFKDPFTGKDDWRLLHMGPGGLLIDSKVNPLKPGQNGSFANSTPIGGNTDTTSNSPSGPVNLGAPIAAITPGQPVVYHPYPSQENPVTPQVPQRAPAISAAGGQLGNPGGNGPDDANPNLQFGPVGPTRRPPQAGVDANGEPLTDANGNVLAAGQPGTDPNSQNGNSSQNAIDQINSLVRRPTPGPQFGGGGGSAFGGNNSGSGFGGGTGSSFGSGSNSSFGGGSNSFGGGPGNNSGLGSTGANNTSLTSFGSNPGGSQLGGGGLAGVASKMQGKTIKRVEDQSDYSKWEFYYDPRKDTSNVVNMPQNGPGGNSGPNGTTPGSSNGNNPAGTSPGSGFTLSGPGFTLSGTDPNPSSSPQSNSSSSPSTTTTPPQ